MRKTLLTLIAGGIAWGMLIRPAAAFESGLMEADGAIRTWRSEAAGLPADWVTAIIQTRDGFLWVGTSAGLVRFDGVKFTPVSLPISSNEPGLWITALCEDSHGFLWVGTQQEGVFQLARGGVQRFGVTNGLVNESVTSLAADGQGGVWIGTKAGLTLARNKKLTSFSREDGLPDEIVSGVHVARSGTVWITTRAGMSRFESGQLAPYALQTESQGRSPEYLGAYEDRRGNLWAYGDTYLVNLTEGKRFNYFRGNEAASVRIFSLCEGRDGRLWIGTSGRGLFCFDENRFQPVILGELRWPYEVRAICEDSEGNLWLGTSGGGLVQLRPQPVHVLRSGQGLPTSSPTALALDANERVFVGLQRGGLFVGENGRFERFGNRAGIAVQEFVSAIAIGHEGTVWAGTLGGGLYGVRSDRGIRYTTAHGLADDSVLSVCVDTVGNVWAGTSAGTVHQFTSTNLVRFDETDGLPAAPVTTLLAARKGGVWLGAEDGSVARGEAGQFQVMVWGERHGRRPVLALHEGADEELWIGTSGGLICQFGASRVHWTTTNGLPHDYIAGVVLDGAQNLWLATGAGIYRISHSVWQNAVGDLQLPLQGKQMAEAKTTAETTIVFGGNRATRAGEDKLWFATSEGVINVDTRRPEVEVGKLPLFFESVSYNGNATLLIGSGAAWAVPHTNKSPRVTPGDLRSLEIQFTALSFSAPERTRFRHKLEGFDPDWVDDGTARVARYGRLPYGQYKFHLEARQADGPWQKAESTFAFEVPTPFYLQAWAIALFGVAAVGAVTGVVRVVSHRRLRRVLARLEQQQSLERERMRIARDMHDEIGSKLTKISFLSEHARMDAKGALAGKIESIAETSRELLQTMDEIVWVVNPHNDTLEHLAAYLSHYADEYFQNTSVDCELRLPQAISHFPVSSEVRHNLFLAFEEALNNVLKHSGATRVRVEMTFQEPTFEVIVTDNGRGFAVAPTSNGAGVVPLPRGVRGGNGLKNMRQRLADIGGECVLRSQPGQGAVVTLRIQIHFSAEKIS